MKKIGLVAFFFIAGGFLMQAQEVEVQQNTKQTIETESEVEKEVAEEAEEDELLLKKLTPEQQKAAAKLNTNAGRQKMLAKKEKQKVKRKVKKEKITKEQMKKREQLRKEGKLETDADIKAEKQKKKDSDPDQ
ncbi:hypothetical protein [Altibacter sp. HG106]|uniref:hypothetical protein n=1 Tax=Altibacter sp. HG106 TaxID=3023937 RepID=UPI002350545B|nr:hypothetical protein [Altibacter sp. HG106]MDC7993634.1 hypothetical protein [Altibacter sp. HG106]